MSAQPIYDKIADRIADALKSGTCPWRKPWNDSVAAGKAQKAANFITATEWSAS